jgi:hypothetical protein
MRKTSDGGRLAYPAAFFQSIKLAGLRTLIIEKGFNLEFK